MLKGSNVKIYGNVEFGDGVIIEDNVIIGHPSAKETKSVGSNGFTNLDDYYNICSCEKTYIGSNSIIRSGSVIYSGVYISDNFESGNNIIIRENSVIGINTYFKSNTEVMKNVKIGNNCRIAGVIADYAVIMNNVSSFGIITHHYSERPKNIEEFNMISPEKAAIVEDNCIIGRSAVLIGNIRIGHDSKIGANAIVNFSVEPYSLVIGKKAIVKKIN